MTTVVEIAGKNVGPGYPVYLIAEIGLNHNGDAELAAKLIRTAAASGVDAVKFQKRDSRSLLTRAAYDAPYESPQAYGATYGAHREALELSFEDLRSLKELADSLDVAFIVSAWDLPSVDLCEELGVVAYKVASADVTNLPLLRRLAQLGKPILMSTGMSDEQEIAEAVETVTATNDRLVLLHCVSTYPSDFEEINLAQIGWLRDRFGLPVGYSGHERGIAVTEAAVALGACAVERHFTLDRTMKGPDHAASLEPTGLMRLVRDIRVIETATGDGNRKISDRELQVRKKLGKSLVAAQNLPEGHVLTEQDLIAKSPGTGLAPNRIGELLGRPLVRPIQADEQVTAPDVGSP